MTVCPDMSWEEKRMFFYLSRLAGEKHIRQQLEIAEVLEVCGQKVEQLSFFEEGSAE